MRLAELGKALGGLDYATVSAAVKRFGERLSKDKALVGVAKWAEAEMLNPKM